MDKLSKTSRESLNLEKLALNLCEKKSFQKKFNQKKYKFYIHPHDTERDIHSNLTFETLNVSFLSENYSDSPTVNESITTSFMTNNCKNDDESDLSNLNLYRNKSCQIPSSKKFSFKINQKQIEEESEVPFSDDNFVEEKFILKDFICNLSINCEEESFLKYSFKEISSISSEQFEIFFDFFIKKNKFYNDLKYALKDKNKIQIDKIFEEWFYELPQYLDFIVNNQNIFDPIASEYTYFSQLMIELIMFSIIYKRDINVETMILLTNSVYRFHQNCIFYLGFFFINDKLDQKAHSSIIQNILYENRFNYINLSPELLLDDNIQNNYQNVIKILKYIKLSEENSVDQLKNIEILYAFLEGYDNNLFNLKEEIIPLNNFLYNNFIIFNKPCNLNLESFLPSKTTQLKYSLVLDLDETLVHYIETQEISYVLLRPGVNLFLEELAKYYELIIFTAATQEYADHIINEMDSCRKISHRLYRQHLSIVEGCGKDLSKLGRDLSKIIIIDNLKENFELQKENGILIKEFIDDLNDTELLDIMIDLVKIAESNVEDIRIQLFKLKRKRNILE